MTISPDARTPSASVHALSGSTPPGAGTTMQPFGIPTVPAASVGATVMPLGGGFDVVGRPRSCGPDAEVIYLAGRVERLAKREHALWGYRADLDDAVTKAMPARPVCPADVEPIMVSHAVVDGARVTTIIEDAGWTDRLRVAQATFALAQAEYQGREAEVAARLGLPLVEKLTHRASARLGRWGLRLAAMEPRTQAGLKAKAAASRATGEDGELLDPWRQRLAGSVGRDAIRIITSEADERAREDQARDGELLALGRAWRDCADRQDRAIEVRDDAETRLRALTTGLPNALFHDDATDPPDLGAYSKPHVEIDRRWYGDPATIARLRGTRLHDACRVRRDEILTAYDAWMVRRKAEEDTVGLTAAWNALKRVSEENAALRRRILTISANTIEGAMVKVAVACWCQGEVSGMEIDLKGYVRTGADDNEAFACGALLDIVRVLGRGRETFGEDRHPVAWPDMLGLMPVAGRHGRAQAAASAA